MKANRRTQRPKPFSLKKGRKEETVTRHYCDKDYCLVGTNIQLNRSANRLLSHLFSDCPRITSTRQCVHDEKYLELQAELDRLFVLRNKHANKLKHAVTNDFVDKLLEDFDSKVSLHIREMIYRHRYLPDCPEPYTHEVDVYEYFSNLPERLALQSRWAKRGAPRRVAWARWGLPNRYQRVIYPSLPKIKKSVSVEVVAEPIYDESVECGICEEIYATRITCLEVPLSDVRDPWYFVDRRKSFRKKREEWVGENS